MKKMTNLDQVSIGRSRRERFEADTLPHLEALWNAALWLTMRSNQAEWLLIETIAQAYRASHLPGDTFSSKARLFRILTREFYTAAKDGQQPSWVLGGGRNAAGNGNGSSPTVTAASIDSQELLHLKAIPDAYVKGAVARLRSQPRLIMMLHLRERFSRADIAYITGLSEDSVKSNLNILRRLIPRCIVEHSGSFGSAAVCDESLQGGSTFLGKGQI